VLSATIPSGDLAHVMSESAVTRPEGSAHPPNDVWSSGNRQRFGSAADVRSVIGDSNCIDFTMMEPSSSEASLQVGKS
jgi:hypothetical protein